MSNLTIFERQLPLRGYPEKDLNALLDTQFKFWIANLLSLKEDKEDAYNVSKGAIKDLCVGMSFKEIGTMLEMYTDSKLDLNPIPNYFDRILLGKIVNSYKKLMSQKSKVMIEEPKRTPEQEKKDIEEAVIRSKLEFDNTGTVKGVITHIYNYLDAQGKFQGSKTDKEWKDFKWKVFRLCQKIHKNKLSIYKIRKDKADSKNETISLFILDDAKTMSKRKILIKYYKNL